MAELVKTFNGLTWGSVNGFRGLARASIKTFNGIDTTSGSFAPTDIAGCQIWLPPNGTSAGSATNWPNSGVAGGTYDAAEATNPPTGVDSVLNGNRIVRFGNGVQRLVVPSFSSLFSSAATAFYVIKPVAGFSSWFYTGGGSLHADIYDGPSYLTTFQASGRQSAYDTPGIGSFQIFMVRAGSTFARYINGGSPPSAPSITFGFQTSDLILGYDGTFPGTCDMGEVIVYDSFLSDANANLVGNYIAGWSGISWTNI